MSQTSDAPSFEQLSPMLAKPCISIPFDSGWLFEAKFSGYRVLACTGPNVRMKSRGGIDVTAWFPEVAKTLSRMPAGSVLDGEVCVLDGLGRTDFNRVHTQARRRGLYGRSDPVVYCVFDVLVFRGIDMMEDPLEDRKDALAQGMRNHTDSLLHVTGTEDGHELFQRAQDMGLEGIVAKRMGSLYTMGRETPYSEWLIIKCSGQK